MRLLILLMYLIYLVAYAYSTYDFTLAIITFVAFMSNWTMLLMLVEIKIISRDKQA